MRNGKICVYVVCDFNEKWLKDSSLLCYIVIVLNVGSKVVYVMLVGCFLELVYLHFF